VAHGRDEFTVNVNRPDRSVLMSAGARRRYSLTDGLLALIEVHHQKPLRVMFHNGAATID